jgi:hypothetical protein
MENVARLLRFRAERGFLRGVDAAADAKYRRQRSACHVPCQISVIFTRDNAQ